MKQLLRNATAQLINLMYTLDPEQEAKADIGRVAAKEIAVINNTFAQLGVNAAINWRQVIASPAGNFVRYPITAQCKRSAITGIVGDIETAVSELRNTDVSIQVRTPRLALELPYPMDTTPLAWRMAHVERLTANQALAGMDYSSFEPRQTVLDFNRKIVHALIGGTTNSGKTNLLAGIIVSLCTSTSPADAQIVFLDTKNDEDWHMLTDLPHVTVAHGFDECVAAVDSVQDELDRRRQTPDTRMVYLIVDEYADLKLRMGDAIDSTIAGIAGIGRSKRIRILLATQKPTVEVVSTLIKANTTSRIGGLVTTPQESQIIMGRDSVGCEDLPGRGSFMAILEERSPVRIQSYYLAPDDLASAVDAINSKWGDVEPYRIAMVAPTDSATLQTSEGDGNLDAVLDAYTYSDLFDGDGKPVRGAKTNVARLLFGEGAALNGTVQREVDRIMAIIKRNGPAD